MDFCLEVFQFKGVSPIPTLQQLGGDSVCKIPAEVTVDIERVEILQKSGDKDDLTKTVYLFSWYDVDVLVAPSERKITFKGKAKRTIETRQIGLGSTGLRTHTCTVCVDEDEYDNIIAELEKLSGKSVYC